MSKLTSLLKADKISRNERIHYSWLRTHYFQEPDYIVYPNVALQVIIDSEYPDIANELLPGKTEWKSAHNFFYNSSVDLCVIRTTDYLPFVAFEIDGESHDEIDRQENDQFKNLLFTKAGIPLERLRVYRDQFTALKQKHLSQAVSRLNRQYVDLNGTSQTIQGKRSILCGSEMRTFFELLKRAFPTDKYVVLPNVALQSIFTSKIRLTEYRERDFRQTGLVDFCVFGATDLYPKLAFSLSKDELSERVFDFFGLPLVDLQLCLETGDGTLSPPEDVVVRIQKRAQQALNCAVKSTSGIDF